MIQLASGLFEYNIDDELVFSGQINFLDNTSTETKPEIMQPMKTKKISDTREGLDHDDVYSIFDRNGYCLGNNYKNIIKYDVSEKYIQGYVKWTEDWVYFIDGLLKFSLLEDLETHKLNAPISIREIIINPSTFKKFQKKDVYYVSYNKATNEINCNGVKISDVQNGSLLLPEIKSTNVQIEEKTFVHFHNSPCQNIDEFITDSMDLVLEIGAGFDLETVNKKLIVCSRVPHHNDDFVFKACTRSLKQNLCNQLSDNTVTLTWGNVNNPSVYDETGTFITITDVNYVNDAMKVLASKTSSYIIVYSDHEMQFLKNWEIILQRKLSNGIAHLALIKKEKKFDENNVFIMKQNYDDYDSSIWRTLDKCNSSTGMIYIVANSEPLEGIRNYVKNMLLKYKSQRLRFLFILDANAPGFESNKSFYKDQLAKGLVVNIYKNGGWGSYKQISVRDFKENTNTTENPIAKNLSTNSENIHSVKYLGFNYKDFVVENNTKNEFGPLDYSGLTKNNQLVMGIASYEQKSDKIKYDSLLSWPIPTTWSPEDATTVPLTYAMTYYVLYVLSSLRREHTILITSGLHPIGQAAIAIGLAEKCDIYAVVESSQDVELLSNIFPQLPRSRMIVNTNNKFDIKLMMTTKSKGVDIVLNFENGEAFQAAFRTIAYHGKLFHFSKSDVETNTNIGTRVFLRDTSFTMVSSTMLLNESDRNKQTVRLAFMDGLNKGVVKPFPIFDSTKSSKNRNIFDTMRIASTLPVPQKVLLSVSDVLADFKSYSVHDKYQFHPDQVNVIVGNKLDWLDAAEWMVDRGARNIVVVVKTSSMSSVNSRRFDRLLLRNVSIRVESDKHLTAKEESLNWLNRLTSFSDLGSLFIVNQSDTKRINNLRYAFENIKNRSKMALFVCISSNGEVTCADLKSIGLNAINISWGETSSQPKSVSRILLSLDTILRNTRIRNSSSYIWSEKAIKKSEWSLQKMSEVIANFFPDSVDDVHDLNEVINRKDAGFVEVQTLSPRFQQLKSVMPVFVIPGFRRKLFEPLYKQFFYPVFEARLPESGESIDELSNKLVEELKLIWNSNSVSLIGESWGGIVALKMAQILEARGTAVTVSLLNGVPKTVTGWAERCLSKADYFAKTLNDHVMHHNDDCDDEESSKRAVHTNVDDSFVRQKSLGRPLNWIRSVLRMIMETKPFQNKLRTKILTFEYEKIAEPDHTANLIEYSDELPSVHIVPGTDYKQMMADKGMIGALTDSVVHPFAAGKETSLSNKYKNLYFYNEKIKRVD